MALRYSFDAGDEADRLEAAVETVLADGLRTADLVGPEGGTAGLDLGDGRRDRRGARRAMSDARRRRSTGSANLRGALYALLAFGVYSTHDVVVKVARRHLLAVPDRVLRQPVRLPDRDADADARPGRRQPPAAPSVVDAAPHRLGGAVDDAGLLRLLGAAAGADLRADLRGAAAHHHPRDPDPRRDRRLAAAGGGGGRAGRGHRRAAARARPTSTAGHVAALPPRSSRRSPRSSCARSATRSAARCCCSTRWWRTS